MFLPFLLATVLNSYSPNPILNDFSNQGYHEMHNPYAGKDFFDLTYATLDKFEIFIENNPVWFEKLSQAENVYLNSSANNLYGNPPIGYVDERKSGKNKKLYFHYTENYDLFLTEHYPELIAFSSEFQQLLEISRKLLSLSKNQIEEALVEIDTEIPLSDHMYYSIDKLAILVKIVRYEKSNFSGSNPHYDFSGLSILLDNSEVDSEKETLLIAPYKEDLVFEDFSRPIRKYERLNTSSSALLIPGLALKHLQINIEPTPHAVLKQDQTRHAIIVFAMIPDIKLTYKDIKLKEIKLPVE